ncbi:MAG: restriction endonuclease subunit S [Ruminococcus sp.]|nr:restriction endonuclease subunit S [Ruminococcus sp.]
MVFSIYQRQIVTLPLPLPPLAEQKRIADVLERALGVFE